MKTIHIHNGIGICADVGTHASRLFHAVRIIRGHFFWGAYASGVMAALSGEECRCPHEHPALPHHVNIGDWHRGFADASCALIP